MGHEDKDTPGRWGTSQDCKPEMPQQCGLAGFTICAGVLKHQISGEGKGIPRQAPSPVVCFA